MLGLLVRRGAVMVAALLALAPAAGALNLVVNPGFETPGSTNNIPGWTFWRAPWGSGETAQATSTARDGSYSLMLTCGSSSFGVYQEVTVTPGKAYQMNGWWRGTFASGQTSWYDCELLNGPFNYTLADQRPDDLQYKVCTYDPASISWSWQKMSDAYGTVVPLLGETGFVSRNGIRVASGNRLTVVLKTGGFSSPYGFYDDITLEEVPAVSIADARKKQDGVAVMVTGAVVSAVFKDCFYIQSADRTPGILVTADSFAATVGKTAKIAGVVKTNARKERYIEATYVSFSN